MSLVVRESRGECRRKQEYIDRLEESLPHCAAGETSHVFLLPVGKAAKGTSDEMLRPRAQLGPRILPVFGRRQAEHNCAQEEEVRVEQLLEAKASGPSFSYRGAVRLSLFGSSARDEAHEDSDIDFVVEFGRPIGLSEFVRLQRELGDLLCRRVELVTPAALKPQLRDAILREAFLVSP